MNAHGKKMVAPIVVTALVVVYYIVYYLLVIHWVTGLLRIVFGVIPAVLAAVMIGVCVQRSKEIRSGEEDDLGKY